MRFRWSRAYGLRFAGLAVILLGACWLVAALAGFATWSLVLLGVVAAVTVVCAVRLVAVPPVLLEISSHGYRVRNVRGRGAPEASWSEVETVTGGSGNEGAVMQIKLRGDRSTVIPLVLLGAQAGVAEREIHERLNAAFGYRRLGTV